MVKAKIGDLVVLGLSRTNIERLQRGMPILFEGSEVNLPGRIAIMFGETELAIGAELRQMVIDNADSKS